MGFYQLGTFQLLLTTMYIILMLPSLANYRGIDGTFIYMYTRFMNTTIYRVFQKEISRTFPGGGLFFPGLPISP